RVLQQRPAEAEASLRAVIAQADSISFDSYLDATHALCWVMTETGRPDSAARIAGGALDRLDPKLADPARARLLYSLGNAELLAGRPGEALEPLCRASLLQGRGAGLSQISRMRSEEALARGFDALGQRDSALFHFRAATRAWERSRAAPNDPAWREAFAGAAATLFCEYAARLLDPAAGGTPAARAARAFTALQDFRSRALEEQLLGAEARAQVARVRLNELQRALADHEVLLDIYPSRDTTVVLAVTRDRILAATTAGAIRLSPRLKRLSELLQSREPGGEGDAQRGAEEALGTDLFGGVADLIRPARSALISAGGWDVHPLGELRVPGETRELSRARELGIIPSATLLAASRRAARQAESAGFLMLARATGPSKSPLDGVKSETRALRARFPHGEFRSNDGDRTLDDMLARVEGREILHVASHTRWNSSAPWRAGFLLGRGDDEEAYLTAARICRLRGAARLCVLASCSSAGQPTVRESMPPLGAAWLAAGAQAVIATLWPVDDAATAEFVAHFYDALERGRSAGGALADAQAATRRTRGREASGYWAGYVLLGDPATHVRLRASAPASPARR
ncbi:MAG TPA: CHAT domain-containing protein, partial [Candidatus Sulfotelmatobacter sp.]|nr:CHAT domain-containing protein [Candidatus Sulfotelmatobacter sp.]